MPTFFTYKHKVVTPFGEMFIKTQEPANENGVDNWIKENQGSVNARFKDKAESLPVKVIAVYIVNGDGTEVKL
ncbi:MAG: hypothetical protein IPH18_00575 [Chitinophagaceae bacterium]|nr:hypothetical protein [Chitinophagaceae bacterium]MBK8951495.1 hypothetical protein [Chitinophagaceae bacterium]